MVRGKIWGRYKKSTLKDSWRKLPAMQDPEVLSMLSEKLHKQIFSKDFDFETSEDQEKKNSGGNFELCKRGKGE